MRAELCGTITSFDMCYLRSGGRWYSCGSKFIFRFHHSFLILSSLQIVVDKIFRVIVVLRGYVVAGVNVRSSEEYFNMETKSLKPMDLWTPSAYEVFRVLTCNANAAMMYFYVPMNPESTFKSYLVR